MSDDGLHIQFIYVRTLSWTRNERSPPALTPLETQNLLIFICETGLVHGTRCHSLMGIADDPHRDIAARIVRRTGSKSGHPKIFEVFVGHPEGCAFVAIHERVVLDDAVCESCGQR